MLSKMFRTKREKSSSFFLSSSPFLILPSIFLCEPKLADQKQIPYVSIFPWKLKLKNLHPCPFLMDRSVRGFFSKPFYFEMYLLGELFGDYPWWEYACCWGLPAYKVIHFLNSQISEKRIFKSLKDFLFIGIALWR